ncbi:MAG: acetylxylan esterase [Planctomycetota bacterium]|nr:MAG: acetylxylan esterase [Planctomycetota bacterium]
MLVVVATGPSDAAPPVNYDESKVPHYTLPDPLVCRDGTRITTPQQWRTKRRPEILELFRSEMYGRAPGRPPEMSFEVTGVGEAFGGRATRKLVTIHLASKHARVAIDVLLYVPRKRQGRVPAFVGLNFRGNHSISTDPEVPLCRSWMRPGPGVVDNRATEATRGVAASRWPVSTILDHGFALVTAYYGDIDPDYDDGFRNGVHALFPPPGGRRSPHDWGSIAAWAWGLSRIMDYLETDPDIDRRHVAVMGHSRLGKTALWAGANDERFALVISNDSGCGGAALSRREYGETVRRINTSFPHWFCDAFKRYNDRVQDLPFDQHMLIALIAPRPVYVASAVEDRWADPRGEFLAALHAEPVYRLFGKPGLGIDRWPPVDQPADSGFIGYHVRHGKHDVTAFDWRQYLKFAARHFAR